jgi:hypothetical protein
MVSKKIPDSTSSFSRAPQPQESARLNTNTSGSPDDNFPFGPSFTDQAMKDSLRPFGKRGRLISCVLCLLFAAAVLFIAVLMWRNVFGPEPADSEFAIPWAAPAILTGVALMLAFFAWRLLRGDVSATGMTSTAPWFLQLCGIVWLLLTIFILAVSDDLTSTFSFMGIFVGIPCSLALIFLPGYLRPRRAPKRSSETANGIAQSLNR